MEIFQKIGDRAKVVGDRAKVVGDRAKVVGDRAKVVGDRAKTVGGMAGERAKDVGDMARSIAKKSSELVEVTKLKYEISKLEKEMENNLTALGELQYRQFKGEEALEAEMDRLLTATAGTEEHITSLQKEVDRLQPRPPVCDDCKEEAPFGANYCPRCGKKLA